MASGFAPAFAHTSPRAAAIRAATRAAGEYFWCGGWMTRGPGPDPPQGKRRPGAGGGALQKTSNLNGNNTGINTSQQAPVQGISSDASAVDRNTKNALTAVLAYVAANLFVFPCHSTGPARKCLIAKLAPSTGCTDWWPNRPGPTVHRVAPSRSTRPKSATAIIR